MFGASRLLLRGPSPRPLLELPVRGRSDAHPADGQLLLPRHREPVVGEVRAGQRLQEVPQPLREGDGASSPVAPLGLRRQGDGPAGLSAGRGDLVAGPRHLLRVGVPHQSFVPRAQVLLHVSASVARRRSHELEGGVSVHVHEAAEDRQQLQRQLPAGQNSFEDLFTWSLSLTRKHLSDSIFPPMISSLLCHLPFFLLGRALASKHNDS